MKTLLALALASASLSAFAARMEAIAIVGQTPRVSPARLRGVSNGALLVAGGANFPGKKPWEGGAKVWYDTVYVLESPSAKWQVAGNLPRPLGYGVSVTHNGGLICAGGKRPGSALCRRLSPGVVER